MARYSRRRRGTFGRSRKRKSKTRRIKKIYVSRGGIRL